MFYNENYQTGVIETYQFLVNNVGDVEKYKDTSAFFLSRYSKYYHQESETLKNFLIFLDVSYILSLIAYTITIIFMIKERIMDVVNYKTITIKWFELLDICSLVLSLVNLGFWILMNWVFEDVTIPFTTESKFKDYITQAQNTKIFWIICSIMFLLLSIRLFRVITEMFPSYGALFETIKVALKDLASFFVSILIISFGFIYAGWLKFGSAIL